MNPYRTPEELASEVAMMTNPARWPNWPTLPVKKIPVSQMDHTGYVYADDTDGPFIIRKYGPMLEATAEVLVQYESAQAAVDDSWVVD